MVFLVEKFNAEKLDALDELGLVHNHMPKLVVMNVGDVDFPTVAILEMSVDSGDTRCWRYLHFHLTFRVGRQNFGTPQAPRNMTGLGALPHEGTVCYFNLLDVHQLEERP